ncbi:hypothetical protein MXB_4104 [Myxobolus squamalis]|nr:hypothetical protein MXB_4104 [Myxobolus squamalis]
MQILKQEARNDESNLIICQFSSIGSLGSNDKWISEEFGKSLTGESYIPAKNRIKLN